MKTSCLTHPAGDTMLVVHAWQVHACEGDPCAAMLLSLFEFYHNLKLEQQEQARKMNEVAEFHGESGQQYTGLLQWHNEEELKEHLLGIYGIKSIRNGLQLLVNKGYISIQSNPNPRYHFDRTRYILFHPEPLQSFLLTYTSDQAKVPDASGKNASPSGKNAGTRIMTSPMTSPMTGEPPPPAELGSDCCAVSEEEATKGTPAPCFPAPGSRDEGTNPRAMRTDLRTQGCSPRQVTAQQADAAQQAASAQQAACPFCDTYGFVRLQRPDGGYTNLRCTHDREDIEAYVARHGLTWPAAPPPAPPTDHGPAP